MRRLIRAGKFLFAFGAARGGLFAAPILLANLLTPADYGMLEMAQAIASAGAPLLALGTGAIVPLVLVLRQDGLSWAAVLLHHLMIAFALAGCAMLLRASGAGTVLWLSLLALAVLMLQGLWSVSLKSQGKGEVSLLMDAGFWGSFTLASLLAIGFSLPAEERWEWAVGALLLYLLLLLGLTGKALAAARPMPGQWHYAATLRAGLPLMVGALLSGLVTTSGRLGIGALSGPEVVADYSVLYRATVLPIVAHQVLMVSGFRQVFELPPALLERRLSLVVALVVACVVGFAALSGVVGFALGPRFVATFAAHRVEGLLILTQCILWSAVSLNDLLAARHQAAMPMVRGTIAYLATALPLAWWFLSRNSVPLAGFVPVHSLVLGGYFLVQVAVLYGRGLRFVKAWALAAGAFSGFSLLALAM